MPRPTQAPAQGAEDGRRCRALEIALLCRGRGFFRGHNRQTLHDWNPSQMESLSMSPSKPGCLVIWIGQFALVVSAFIACLKPQTVQPTAERCQRAGKNQM